MELTQHQGRVGSVLQEGNQLISDGSLTSEAEAEVCTLISPDVPTISKCFNFMHARYFA